MRLRRQNSDDNAVPTWQTIYCSLVLIMLVMFVMLVSYSVLDKGRMHNFRDNSDHSTRPDGELGRENNKFSSFGSERMPTAVWMTHAMAAMRQAEIRTGLEGAVLMERVKGGVKFRMKGDFLFSSGKTIIKGEAYPYLDEMIRVAKEHELSISIEGHTDDVVIHNEAFPSNWELSAARATNVLRYCLEKGKIPPGRLSAAGFGSYRPLVPNDTLSGRMRNRRIEVLLAMGHT